jgi:hypothetical protein
MSNPARATTPQAPWATGDGADGHTCALPQEGVKGRGDNANGQLGDGRTAPRALPTDVDF